MATSERDWAEDQAGVLGGMLVPGDEATRALFREAMLLSLRQAETRGREDEKERCARMVETAYQTFHFGKRGSTYFVLLDFSTAMAKTIRADAPSKPEPQLIDMVDDQPITERSEFCRKWPCCRDRKRVVVRDGYWKCEGCDASYGSAKPEPLYTFTADGSEGSPPTPWLEEACKRGDVFARSNDRDIAPIPLIDLRAESGPLGPIADEDGCCSGCGRGLEPCPACSVETERDALKGLLRRTLPAVDAAPSGCACEPNTSCVGHLFDPTLEVPRNDKLAAEIRTALGETK